jgi:hypothetical protein
MIFPYLQRALGLPLPPESSEHQMDEFSALLSQVCVVLMNSLEDSEM